MSKFIAIISGIIIALLAIIFKRGKNEKKSKTNNDEATHVVDDYVPSDIVSEHTEGLKESVVESAVESAVSKSDANTSKLRKRDSKGRFVKSE